MTGEQVQNVRASRLRLALGALLIFALVLVVYRPILPGSFLMDDRRLIGSDNPLMNGELTPRSIWFRTDFTLTTFVWWMERQVFGDNPARYHAVNMALQALSAVLLWRLLARLKIPGAWLAAAIFAVHPVCVNSVARVAELKNTLSLPFFLFSFWGYLHYEALALYPVDRDRTANGRLRRQATLWFTLSLLAFVLALLSKTTAVMLPPVLLLCAAWQRRRITRQDVLHTSPYFVLALAFGLMSLWFQKHQALVGESLAHASFGEKLAGAGQNFWFYLGKALLPVHLSVFYVREKIDAAAPAAYLPVLLAVAVFVLCWGFRRTWGRHALFGLGCFVVTLFPVLGFFDAQFLAMLRVSDHLQYKPLIALVALTAAALASLLPGKVLQYVAIVLLLALSVLSFKRAQVFATEESLMRDTLAKYPAAWPAHNDLGIILANREEYPAAIDHFTASLRYNPDNSSAHSNYGHLLALQGKFEEAEAHFRAALKIKPDSPETHQNFAEALARQGRNREAILHLQAAINYEPRFQPKTGPRLELAALFYQTGDSRQAVSQFRRVLLLNPDEVAALNNLAWILATCPDDGVRDGNEAVQCAERACRLTGFTQAGVVSALAAAYAEAGRFPEAVATAEQAVTLANAVGNTQIAAVNRQLLTLYRAGKPWREKPVVNRSQ
ncbi:MAG: tetratricopeptide repeat protein [Verrucomicrobiota bacterium]|jgi:tetratricopeptide (TPR) repeat protein